MSKQLDPPIKTITDHNKETGEKVVITRFNEVEMARMAEDEIYRRVIQEVTEVIADEFVKSRAQEVIGKVDLQGLANLVAIRSAKKIREMITK